MLFRWQSKVEPPGSTTTPIHNCTLHRLIGSRSDPRGYLPNRPQCYLWQLKKWEWIFFGHRCTRVENPGEGVRDVFAKIPRGGSRVAGKIARGGPPILCFIAFLLTSFSKICLGGGGVLFHTPLPPYPPAPCVHLCFWSM